MLKRPARRILINEAIAKEVVLIDAAGAEETTELDYATDTVQIQMHRFGLDFLPGDIIQSTRVCSASGTARIVTVQVTGFSTDDLNREYIVVKIKLLSTGYKITDIHSGRHKTKVIEVVGQPGVSLGANAVAAEIAANINSDKELVDEYGISATVSTDTVTITGNDLQDFQCYVDGGTATIDNENQVFARATLTDDDMTQLFPIGKGSFGEDPQRPIKGATYCKYYLKVKANNKAQDLAHSQGYIDTYNELELYLQDTTNNRTRVDAKLAAFSSYSKLT